MTRRQPRYRKVPPIDGVDDLGMVVAAGLLSVAAAVLILLAVLFASRTAGAGDVCLSKKQARHLWPRSHIYWYSADHCWSNRRGPPRHIKIEPERKKEPKKIKGDPVFNKIRADEKSLPAPPDKNPAVMDADKEDRANDPPTRRGQSSTLNAVTWHMARPFDQAQPIYPPLNLAVPDDPDVWPDLSEFERRFVGVQP